ncbi:uncharacterized protein BDW47DRAFT_132177 [Aspergillus candidus]|uniref:NTF2-like protein n=1 Tax=Aspergillus candidus TaxID=41067 RepID=A0A2I2F982_ASPCN|nr:hypothetical protein BDW47DRAFT_132177 [Aspergillus candidus]PLB37183.1 hypothetical protein BDW47DRAFT_132177 [Aspergillus candidus]
MIFKDLYQRYLASPRTASLAADVALNYIPTTIKVEGADAVLHHLTRQDHVIKTKSETILDAVEGNASICVDVETTVEFVSGGGAYLPTLDDNFLSDRVATFPTIHIVRFNAQNQIHSVRIYWDQASLLKQVEVIGARSRAWPVRDAKEQFRLIKAASSATPAPATDDSVSSRPTSRSDEPESKRASPGKKHIKDPYAAESLFHLLSPDSGRPDPVRPPRAPASAQPPSRNLDDLFVRDDNVQDAPDATPSKSTIAPKAGSSKNFQRARIFDDDDTAREHDGPQQIAYRANPKRYQHFELGADNSEREIKHAETRPLSYARPQWNFEDFATPEKAHRRIRPEEVRHFGWSDDEAQETPPARPHVPHPRPDAKSQIHMGDPNDEGNGARIISSFQNKGMGLYKNPLYSEDDNDEEPALQDVSNQKKQQRPLSVVNRGPNRRNDFENHWNVTDEAPPVAPEASAENEKPAGSDRQTAVRMMEPSWGLYDESPQPRKFVNVVPGRRAGKHTTDRSWNNIYGDE